MATKVFTRSDGKVKHLLSLRDWKWDCPKCAPLLKSYWLERLGVGSFRFILKLPTTAKPTAFLRRVGKPNYVHIVADGESWLFLTDGDSEKVWAEIRNAGYDLIAGDISGDPAPDEIRDCLEQALCVEVEPLNTRRKVTHSRGLLRKLSGNTEDNESKEKDDCARGENGMSVEPGNEPPTWETEVVMKPIEEIAKELEAEGWHISWKSEVEAVAVKDEALKAGDLDIVELIENLGVKLKKTGKEYKGLCPFHNERDPSLSVNRERGLWHCFGCDRGGGVAKFTCGLSTRAFDKVSKIPPSIYGLSLSSSDQNLASSRLNSPGIISILSKIVLSSKSALVATELTPFIPTIRRKE